MNNYYVCTVDDQLSLESRELRTREQTLASNIPNCNHKSCK